MEDGRRVDRQVLRFLLRDVGQAGEESASDIGGDREPMGILDGAECTFDLA